MWEIRAEIQVIVEIQYVSLFWTIEMLSAAIKNNVERIERVIHCLCVTTPRTTIISAYALQEGQSSASAASFYIWTFWRWHVLWKHVFNV